MSMNDVVRRIKIHTKVTLLSMNCELGKVDSLNTQRGDILTSGVKMDGRPPAAKPRMTEPFIIPSTPNTVCETPSMPDYDDISKFDPSESEDSVIVPDLKIYESPLYQRRVTKSRKTISFELPATHKNSLLEDDSGNPCFITPQRS